MERRLMLFVDVRILHMKRWPRLAAAGRDHCYLKTAGEWKWRINYSTLFVYYLSIPSRARE